VIRPTGDQRELPPADLGATVFIVRVDGHSGYSGGNVPDGLARLYRLPGQGATPLQVRLRILIDKQFRREQA
jgi:hypothetical protein